MFCRLHDFVPPAFGLPASSMSTQERHVTDPSSQAVVNLKPTHGVFCTITTGPKWSVILHPHGLKMG